MTDIYLLGDIHGDWKTLNKRIQRVGADGGILLQLGDLGLGFPKMKLRHGIWQQLGTAADIRDPVHGDRFVDRREFAEHFYFIRGNHDNPRECIHHPNYMGNFGHKFGVFFVSGGASSDRALRQDGVDWWPDEEMSRAQLEMALDIYVELKPEVVISHEAPSGLPGSLYTHHSPTSRTSQALGSMLSFHRPKQWFFGHHHKQWIYRAEGTEFRCLNINEMIKL